MKKLHPLRKLFLCLMSVMLIPATSPAHTEAIGYVLLGHGQVEVWFGTYHSFGSSPAFEGQAQLTTPTGSILNVPFTLSTDTRPTGLVDDVNLLLANGFPSSSLVAWQGVLFTGLKKNGHYTVGYDPSVPLNSSKWSNAFGDTVGFDIVGLTPLPPPTVATLFVVDNDAIHSVYASGLPIAQAQREVVFSTMQTATRDIGARLFSLRAGLSLGDDASGLPPVAEKTARYDGKTVYMPKDGKSPAPMESVFRHVQIFATGDFGTFDNEDIGSEHGYGADIQVATVGAEYRLNRHIAFGLAASYINSNTEISRNVGSVDAEGMAFSAYVSAAWRHVYADLLYSYGVLDDQIHRHTLAGSPARGDAENRNHVLEFNTGYDFQCAGLHTGPLATLKWIHGDLDGYRETGGGSAALEVPGQNFDSLTSRLGWQLSYTVPASFGTITPQVRASWDHEYLDSSEIVSGSLQQSPFSTITGSTVTRGGRFSASTRTAQPGRDYLNVGAGAAIQFCERVTGSVEYETHVFQEGQTAHLGSVKIAVAF